MSFSGGGETRRADRRCAGDGAQARQRAVDAHSERGDITIAHSGVEELAVTALGDVGRAGTRSCRQRRQAVSASHHGRSGTTRSCRSPRSW